MRRALAVAPAAVAAAYCLPAAAAVWPAAGKPLGVRSRVESGSVLLTFDDGPHPKGTPAVLEVLREAEMTATFFLVGEQVERCPQLAVEIASAGHELALHCYRHRCLLRLTPRQVHDDLRRAEATIGEATSVSPHRYRPPYGILNSAALAFAHVRGWEPILWSKDGRDWQRRATPDSIARRVTRGLAANDVVLLHDSDQYSALDSWRRTVVALPRIVEAIESRRATATPPSLPGGQMRSEP